MKASSEGGKDQLTSRCAALLDLNHVDFAILPPHFSLAEELPDFGTLLPDYETLPVSFHGVVRILFAQLVHHHDFLIATFPQDHPLFKSAIYTSGTVAQYIERECLHSPTHYSCSYCPMKATGVPPHILALFKMEMLSTGLETQHNETRRVVTDLMTTLGEQLQALPESIAKELEARFKIDGKDLRLASVKELLALQMQQIQGILQSNGRDRPDDASRDGDGAGGNDDEGAESGAEADTTWWKTFSKTLKGQSLFCFTPDDFIWPAYVCPSYSIA
jgi:hypothetical protein